MDNNNQMPSGVPGNNGMSPQPMDGAPQNEVSRILMEQRAAAGGISQGGLGGQANMMQGGMNNVNMNGGNMMGGPMAASAGSPMGGQAGAGFGTQPGQPGMPAGAPMGAQPIMGADGRPMMQVPQPVAQPTKKKDIVGLIKTIAIIVMSLVAVTFIGLFIWMNSQYQEEKSRDLDSEINAAVAKAQDEQATKLEAEFLDREKYPYKTFSGPIDYGQLTFEYPKTWSVYVAAAATDGGDFNAYFNPIQVDAVGKDTINALRVTIRNKSFDEVVAEYQKAMEKKDSGLTVVATTVAGTAANRYTGKIPNTELSGIIVVFKIRDKAVIMQTDSMFFEDDFNKLLDTVSFNE